MNLISTVDGSTIKWSLLIKKRFVFTKELNGQDGNGDLRMETVKMFENPDGQPAKICLSL